MDKQVSIIIPVFEPHYLIDECLQTLLSYTANVDLIKEVIIIDNSEESMWPVLAKYNALASVRDVNIIYIKSNINLFHVGSINMGLKYATGYYTLLFNDDISIPLTQNRWLGMMIDALEKYEKCEVVTVCLVHRDNSIYWIGLGEKNQHIKHFDQFDFIPSEDYFESAWSNMACYLTRRKLFDIIPFDGQRGDGRIVKHYKADNFFGRRLRDEYKWEQVVRRDVWLYHYNERNRIKTEDWKRTKRGRP